MKWSGNKYTKEDNEAIIDALEDCYREIKAVADRMDRTPGGLAVQLIELIRIKDIKPPEEPMREYAVVYLWLKKEHGVVLKSHFTHHTPWAPKKEQEEQWNICKGHEVTGTLDLPGMNPEKMMSGRTRTCQDHGDLD